MKIAQVAPLNESIPPRGYGGSERVVHYLTEALVDAGHDVTLYASADSRTSARLVPCIDRALRQADGLRDPTAAHLAMIERVCQEADRFHVIHFHTDYLHFAAVRNIATPDVTTLHGRLDIPDLHALFRFHPKRPLISISNDQRHPIPDADWHGTIHNGIPAGLYRPNLHGGDYLAFLGRMSPEKRPDRAIRIALRAGFPIRLAAKLDVVDKDYFDSHVRPLLQHPLVEFIGEIGDDEKGEFLGNAMALLLPIDWSEPFGMVMIEAMACGTPVVAWRRGAVPEVLDEGVTGFVVETLDDAVTAVGHCADLDRAGVRQRFEARFSAARMADQYLRVYRNLTDRSVAL